jgi:hypothetical protein
MTEYGTRALELLALNTQDQSLSQEERMLLMTLAVTCDDTGRTEADLDALATAVDCSARQLRRLVTSLRDKGLLARTKEDGTPSRRGGVFQIDLDLNRTTMATSDTANRTNMAGSDAANRTNMAGSAVGTDPAILKTSYSNKTSKKSKRPYTKITEIKKLTSPATAADTPLPRPATRDFNFSDELLAIGGRVWDEILVWFEENVPKHLANLTYFEFVDWALIQQREYWGGRQLRGQTDEERHQLLVAAVKKWFSYRYKKNDYSLYDQLFCRVVQAFDIRHEAIPRNAGRQATQKKALVRLRANLLAEGLRLDEYALRAKQILNYRSHVNLTVNTVISEQMQAEVRARREAQAYSD